MKRPFVSVARWPTSSFTVVKISPQRSTTQYTFMPPHRFGLQVIVGFSKRSLNSILGKVRVLRTSSQTWSWRRQPHVQMSSASHERESEHTGNALFEVKPHEQASEVEHVLRELLAEIKAPPIYEDTTQNPSDTRRASVALILRTSNTPVTEYQDQFAFELLFIQRASRDSDPWSGDIAFPGGVREPTDYVDLSVAMRETNEELGLDLSDVNNFRLVGRLPNRPIRGSKRSRSGVLSAFVFFQLDSGREMELKPQPSEVASVFWVPLSKLQGYGVRNGHILDLKDSHNRGRSLLHSVFGRQLRMSAVDVLPHAKGFLRVGGEDGPETPNVLLWGMTLSCVGDLIQVMGGRRVDRPSGVPDIAIIAVLIYAIADVMNWVLASWRLIMIPQTRRITFE